MFMEWTSGVLYIVVFYHKILDDERIPKLKDTIVRMKFDRQVSGFPTIVFTVHLRGMYQFERDIVLVESNWYIWTKKVVTEKRTTNSISFQFEELKGVPKLTQDLNLIENTVFSTDYVIFLLNYKAHRIGLFVE